MIGTVNWIEPCDTTAVVTERQKRFTFRKKWIKKSNQIKSVKEKSGDQNVQNRKREHRSEDTQKNTDKKMKEGGLWLSFL